MNNEFVGGRELKVTLDMKFRKYRSLIGTSLNQPSRKGDSHGLRRSLAIIKSKCHPWSEERRFRLISDLLHMHMNRFFNSEQRKHELIVYYLRFKHYNCEGKWLFTACPNEVLTDPSHKSTFKIRTNR